MKLSLPQRPYRRLFIELESGLTFFFGGALRTGGFAFAVGFFSPWRVTVVGSGLDVIPRRGATLRRDAGTDRSVVPFSSGCRRSNLGWILTVVGFIGSRRYRVDSLRSLDGTAGS